MEDSLLQRDTDNVRYNALSISGLVFSSVPRSSRFLADFEQAGLKFDFLDGFIDFVDSTRLLFKGDYNFILMTMNIIDCYYIKHNIGVDF